MRAETALKIIGFAFIVGGAIWFGTGGSPGYTLLLSLILFLVVAVEVRNLVNAASDKKVVTRAARALSSRDRNELDRIYNKTPRRQYPYLLHVAAEHGDHDFVKRLIATEVDVDADVAGSTAIYAAAVSGHSDIVATLIAHGADVNLGASPPDRPDSQIEYGQSPLDAALHESRNDIVLLLLEHGADAEEVLLREGHYNIVLRALEHGAQLEQFHDSYVDLKQEQQAEFDSRVLAFARRLQAEGRDAQALELYKGAVKLWRGMPLSARVPEHVLVGLRALAEAHEHQGDWQEALDRYCDAIYLVKLRRAASSGGVALLIGTSVDPEFFSRASLEELDVGPDPDGEELAVLLRGCERVLGRLCRIEEQERVAALLGRLART